MELKYAARLLFVQIAVFVTVVIWQPLAIAAVDDIDGASVPATEIPDDVEKAAKDLLATDVDVEKLDVMQTRSARALMAGHGKSVQAMVADMVVRLGMATDPKDVTVELNASAEVNAMVSPDPKGKKIKIFLNAGLLGFVSNQDELAFVIAHEMTHANRNFVRKPGDNSLIEKIMKSMPKTLKPGHLEELRADLGAILRMIDGGFNPWGGSDFFRKLAANRDTNGNSNVRTLKAFLSTHPDPQLRMSITKSFITAIQSEENLMKVTKYNSFPPGIKRLNWRLAAYRGLAEVNKLKVGALAVAAMGAQVTTALLVSPETAETMGMLLRPGVDIIGGVSSLREMMFGGVADQAASTIYSGGMSGAGLNAANSATDPSFSSRVVIGATEAVSTAAKSTAGAIGHGIGILADVPVEKIAATIGSLASSGFGAKWAINRIRAKRVAETEEQRFEAMYREYVDTQKQAMPIRKAEKRTEEAVKVFAGLQKSGQYDRTKLLEFAFDANLKTFNISRSDLRNVAYKHGFTDYQAAVRVGQRILQGARERNQTLIQIFADMLPKLSSNQIRRIVLKIEALPFDEFLGTEFEESIRGMIALAKERDPNLRLSSKLERFYLTRSRALARQAPAAKPLVSKKPEISEVYKFMGILDELDKAYVTVYDKSPKPVPTAFGTKYVTHTRLRQNNIPNELKRLIDVWLEEVAVPGERGEKAERYLKKAIQHANSILDSMPHETHAEFNDRIIEALYRNVLGTESVRLSRLPWTLGLADRYDRKAPKTPFGSDSYLAYDIPPRLKHLKPEADLYLRKLQTAKSVVELDDLVQSLLVKGEGLRVEDEPISLLYKHFAEHPELLKTADDIDRLLKSPYLWNQLGTGNGYLDREILFDMRKRYGNSGSQADLWKYKPEASERVQKLIVAKQKELGKTPATFNDRLKQWQMFVGRGVTNTTDTMFDELYRESDVATRRRLRTLAEGRIWEPRLRSNILRDRITDSPEYQSLVATSRDLKPTREAERARLGQLRNIIRVSEREFDSRGPEYETVLEEVLKDIRSSSLETRFAERYRGVSNKQDADLTMRTLSSVVERLRMLSSGQKWEFILWLRGEGPATKAIEEMFPAIGSDRVARMYSLLPDYQKALVIDSVLDAKEGLLPTADVNSFWGRKIVDHLIGGSKDDAKDVSKNRQIAREILESYLASFDGPGANKAQRTLVLSYMLASKGGDGSNGKVLKQVLEAMGASGIKIGQFLVATNLLGDEENQVLRKLQDGASAPLRTRIYSDLKKATQGFVAPDKIDDLLGSASIKYAVQGFDVEDGHPFVLKVLRAEANATVEQQFARLDAMAAALVKKYGGKYAVLKSIIRASKEAVTRELVLGNETKNSAKAAKVYESLSDFIVPQEKLVDPTIIKSDFAKGGSIHDLDLQERGRVANRIMEVERNILFADADVIEFDPDRHPGNFKVEIDGENRVRVRPIDFGQFISITRTERTQLIDLFAQVAILDQTGPTKWSVDRIAETLKLDKKESSKLMSALKSGFPAKDRTGLASYYTLLAALEEIGRPMPIQFFDFARAVVQHNQYEEMVVKSLEAQGLSKEEALLKVEAPRKKLLELVKESATRQIATAKGVPEFSKVDRVRIVWNRSQKIVDEVISDFKTQTRDFMYRKIIDPRISRSKDCALEFKGLKAH